VRKVTKEVDEIVAQEMLTEEHYIRLNIIDRQLEEKLSLMAGLEVLVFYDLGEIKSEIGESETVTVKIHNRIQN